MSSQPLPLFLVLLLAFASGLVLACAYFAFSYVRQSYLLRKRDKQIQGLEKELEHLQSDPSVDAPSLRNFNTRKL